MKLLERTPSEKSEGEKKKSKAGCVAGGALSMTLKRVPRPRLEFLCFSALA